MSSIVNKIKEAISSDKHDTTHSTTHGTGVGSSTSTHNTSGSHNSDLLNKADPRVDSDRDGRSGLSSGTTGTGFTGTTGTHTGTHTGAHNTSGTHNSDLLNKADPRVDSDRDGRSGLSGTGTTGSGLTGSHTGAHTGTHTGSHNTSGPHNSDLLNKADPRVDSDRDGRSGLSGTTGSGVTGTHTGSHNTSGPHNSDLLNKADPRVDSDRDGRSGLSGTTGTHGSHNTAGHIGAAVGGTHGTGHALHTAGPHQSDLANKLDPRVDSDLDGSKTVGGNKTFSQS